jgi:hypothetical protein
MRRWRYEPIYYRQRMFDEFVERDATGRVRFDNRLPGGATSRDRCWPVFSPVKRKRWKRLPLPGARHALANRAIQRDARIAAARGWLCCNPLLVHVMTVEDARRIGRLRT